MQIRSDDEEIPLLSATISASSPKGHVTEVIFRVTFILIATEALTSAISKWRFAPSDHTQHRTLLGSTRFKCARLGSDSRPEIRLEFF